MGQPPPANPVSHPLMETTRELSRLEIPAKRGEKLQNIPSPSGPSPEIEQTYPQDTDSAKNVMHSKKKGLLISCTQGGLQITPPREFTNWSFLIQFKGLRCGNPTERGDNLKSKFGAKQGSDGAKTLGRTSLLGSKRPLCPLLASVK